MMKIDGARGRGSRSSSMRAGTLPGKFLKNPWSSKINLTERPGPLSPRHITQFLKTEGNGRVLPRRAGKSEFAHRGV
jgi:hypothetical protein